MHLMLCRLSRIARWRSRASGYGVLDCWWDAWMGRYASMLPILSSTTAATTATRGSRERRRRRRKSSSNSSRSSLLLRASLCTCCETPGLGFPRRRSWRWTCCSRGACSSPCRMPCLCTHCRTSMSLLTWPRAKAHPCMRGTRNEGCCALLKQNACFSTATMVNPTPTHRQSFFHCFFFLSFPSHSPYPSLLWFGYGATHLLPFTDCNWHHPQSKNAQRPAEGSASFPMQRAIPLSLGQINSLF